MSSLFSTPKTPNLPPPPSQSSAAVQEAARKARQRALYSGRGMGGTLLTGGEGLTSQAPTGTRSLLGG